MKPECLKQVSICKCINKGSTRICFMEIIFTKLDVYLTYLLAGRSKTNLVRVMFTKYLSINTNSTLLLNSKPVNIAISNIDLICR